MFYDSIDQLPERYQEQARQKLQQKHQHGDVSKMVGNPYEGQLTMQKTKYGNTKVTVEGIRFDSQKEARRYLALRGLLECDEIADLRLQVNFTLVEGYTTADGQRVRPMVYKADFTYYKRGPDGAHSNYIVEDVKSKATRTKTYLLKRKLMREKYGIDIQEV